MVLIVRRITCATECVDRTELSCGANERLIACARAVHNVVVLVIDVAGTASRVSGVADRHKYRHMTLLPSPRS